MKFAVEWKETVIDELTAIWLGADSIYRRRITAAADEVDRLLQSDPESQGESREGHRRILFLDPLAVTFYVDRQANKVEVLRVLSTH